MNKKEIYAVGVKIVGLWVLTRTVGLVPIILGEGIVTGPAWLSRLAWLFPMLVCVAAGLCMLKWSGAIAAAACGPGPCEVQEGRQKEALWRVLFSLVGVVVLAGVADVTASVICAFAWTSQHAPQLRMAAWTGIVALAARLAIGIFLMFGSARLVRLVARPATNPAAGPESV